MKAILEFNLPEEREEFELAQRAGKAEAIITDIWQLLRQKTKYEDQSTIDIEDLKEFISRICSEEGVPF